MAKGDCEDGVKRGSTGSRWKMTKIFFLIFTEKLREDQIGLVPKKQETIYPNLSKLKHKVD